MQFALFGRAVPAIIALSVVAALYLSFYLVEKYWVTGDRDNRTGLSVALAMRGITGPLLLLSAANLSLAILRAFSIQGNWLAGVLNGAIGGFMEALSIHTTYASIAMSAAMTFFLGMTTMTGAAVRQIARMIHVSITFLWTLPDFETGAPVYKSRPPEYDFTWGGPNNYNPNLKTKLFLLPRLLFYRMAYMLTSDVQKQVSSNWGAEDNLNFSVLYQKRSLQTRFKMFLLESIFLLLSAWSFVAFIVKGLIFEISGFNRTFSFSVKTMFSAYLLLFVLAVLGFSLALCI